VPVSNALPGPSVFAIVALSLLAASVQAQAATRWQDEARQMDFQGDAGGFRYASVRPGHADAERLSGVFDLDEARFNWGFQANRSAPTEESGIVFHALLEWRDLDADGSFSVGDEVVRRLVLADLANASVEVLPRPPDGRIVHAIYPFPGAKPGPLDPLTGRRILSEGGVTLSFHIFGAGQALGSQAQQPTRTPLDVRIEKFARTRNDSRLGLELQLQSAGTMQVTALAWQADHTVVAHDLAWSAEHARNGSLRATRMAAFERPGEPGFRALAAQTTLVAAYEEGAILHSFSFGTEPKAQTPPGIQTVVKALVGDAGLYAAGAAACLLLVGATAARRLRRRD
jgi:hypothetical protein